MTLDFVEQCLALAARINTGSVGCAQFDASGEAGTCGRTMVYRFLFRKLGWYGEMVHLVGGQDMGLIYRVLSCKGVGGAIQVDTKSMVGASIDTRPGATWSECIKQKVGHTDPSKYSNWNYGYMDHENWKKMYKTVWRLSCWRDHDQAQPRSFTGE